MKMRLKYAGLNHIHILDFDTAEVHIEKIIESAKEALWSSLAPALIIPLDSDPVLLGDELPRS